MWKSVAEKESFIPPTFTITGLSAVGWTSFIIKASHPVLLLKWS